jgi:hemerythrin superfamily protein
VPEDVVTLITDDHRRLERLFDQLRQDRGARNDVVPALAALLLAHARAEEQHVYPAIVESVPREEGDVHHGQQEHAEAEDLLHRLEACDPGSDEFDETLGELRDAVLHHVEEEESEVLAALQEAVPAQRLVQLGEAFSDARRQELEDAGFADLVDEEA